MWTLNDGGVVIYLSILVTSCVYASPVSSSFSWSFTPCVAPFPTSPILRSGRPHPTYLSHGYCCDAVQCNATLYLPKRNPYRLRGDGRFTLRIMSLEGEGFMPLVVILPSIHAWHFWERDEIKTRKERDRRVVDQDPSSA